MLACAVAVAFPLAFPVAAAAPVQPRPISDVRYRCADGARLRARYYRDRVRVTLPAGAVTLPQQPSGSGIRYGNDTLEFSSKGPTAFVAHRGRDAHGECHDVAEP